MRVLAIQDEFGRPGRSRRSIAEAQYCAIWVLEATGNRHPQRDSSIEEPQLVHLRAEVCWGPGLYHWVSVDSPGRAADRHQWRCLSGVPSARAIVSCASGALSRGRSLLTIHQLYVHRPRVEGFWCLLCTANVEISRTGSLPRAASVPGGAQTDRTWRRPVRSNCPGCGQVPPLRQPREYPFAPASSS